MSDLTPYARARYQVRGGLAINVVRQVRLSFEPDDEDGPEARMLAVLRCMTCDEGFAWNPEAGWWVCLSCGIELTADELADFLEVARRSLKDLNTDVGSKRGGRWHWLRRLLRFTRKAR